MWLRMPAPPLRAALGEMSQLLLDGQHVVPARAATQGFTFRHPSLEGALRDLLGRDPLRAVSPAAAVYFNGDCPVCSAEIAHYARRCAAAGLPIEFVDSMQQPQALLAHGLRAEHLERRLFLRRDDGQLQSGVAAMIELWRNTPGYRWLARIVALPGVRQMADFGYDHLVAPALTRLGRWRRRRRDRGSDRKRNPVPDALIGSPAGDAFPRRIGKSAAPPL
jgi:predicted DCC family thiol-disulfide oxidoreductase YuxK